MHIGVSAPPRPMAPDLSVIIPSVNGLEILVECLAAVRRNESDRLTLEILVVERCGDAVRQALAHRLPEVVVLPVDAAVAIPEMRAIGLQHARGEVVAVIEDHVIVPPDWAQQLCNALAGGAAVVGGSVYNAATDTVTDWAAFFCEYSHVLAPEAGQDVKRITGNNVAYRRELGERYSAMLRAGKWEDEFHDALRRDGITLMCAPAIAVGHKMHYRMTDYLSQRYLYSRARTGGASREMSLTRRLLAAAKSTLLPPVLFTRIVRRVLDSRRHHRQLFQSLPLLAVFVCAWAAGEAVGYAIGPGNALAKVR